MGNYFPKNKETHTKNDDKIILLLSKLIEKSTLPKYKTEIRYELKMVRISTRIPTWLPVGRLDINSVAYRILNQLNKYTKCSSYILCLINLLFWLLVSLRIIRHHWSYDISSWKNVCYGTNSCLNITRILFLYREPIHIFEVEESENEF